MAGACVIVKCRGSIGASVVRSWVGSLSSVRKFAVSSEEESRVKDDLPEANLEKSVGEVPVKDARGDEDGDEDPGAYYNEKTEKMGGREVPSRRDMVIGRKEGGARIFESVTGVYTQAVNV